MAEVAGDDVDADLRVVSTDSRIRANASQLGFEIVPAS
jgi:hypothetical protein